MQVFSSGFFKIFRDFCNKGVLSDRHDLKGGITMCLETQYNTK